MDEGIFFERERKREELVGERRREGVTEGERGRERERTRDTERQRE